MRCTIDDISGRSARLWAARPLPPRNLCLPVLGLLLVGAAGATVLVGCGSGGGSGATAAASTKQQTGKATLKITWPSRSASSKLIPIDSNSIVVSMSKNGVVVATQTVARPTTGNSSTCSFPTLPTGDLTMTASAYPSADGTGVAQANASTAVTIVANQIANVGITMASTIAGLAITPASPTVTVGETTPLTETAYDSSGNVVLTSTSISWASDNTAAATVTAGGVVTGVAAGTANITVSDGESGKTATILVTVKSISATPTPALLTSWATQYSARYARVVQATGTSEVTTWPSAGYTNHGGGQSIVAYSDVQQVSYSSDYVYVKATGLASHQMGPWYISTGVIFGNWPSNQKVTFRFPLTPTPATAKTTNGLGSLGLWVNGVAMFNLLDAYSYSTSTQQDVQGTPGSGVWVRNAVNVEAPTFDASNAHQPTNGQYHYHDNPLALRYQLNDNVSYNTATGTYSENTANLHHSPILGWAEDGYPVYGPYGYSDPANAASGVRRMVSGFTIRDGTRGTINLANTGRHSLAKWAAALHSDISTTYVSTDEYDLTSSNYGPNTNATYTQMGASGTYSLGRYVEDFSFLGDLGYTQGTDFDLDVYNGRFCVTPDFPKGTYAYFTTIDSTGAPAFPYTLGRQFYGTPSGGQVTSVTESVTTYLTAGPNTPITTTVTSSGSGKQVQWVSIEGGHYTLQGSNDNSNWTAIATNIASGGLATTYTIASSSPAANYAYYRVILTSTDKYDSF